MNVKLSDGRILPMEMHKVRIVQQTNLTPAAERLRAMTEAGYNTFLLRTRDVFMDMLTDSGTNAMSDRQLAAMMVSDDAYAGSESFYRLQEAVEEVFGFKYVLPVHQGRAAEHLLARLFVKPGDVVPMNYHFTTTKAHFNLLGGTVLEILRDGALIADSREPFKGDMDLDQLRDAIATHGADKISFVRMECTTNLIGGQPFSLANLKEIRRLADEHGLTVVVDASLISENAYLIKQREAEYHDWSIKAIIQEIMGQADIMYLSGRKSCAVRGGMIATNNEQHFKAIMPWLPVYEGFLTYGGMSTKEIEAMAVGIREMCDDNVAGASVEFIRHFVERLVEKGVPVVTPPGGLACHVDAMRFAPHVPQHEYTAGAVAAAIYLASGVRSMERGTVSMDRDEAGNESLSDMELARLAVPRRVYTLSQIEYAVDRLAWLYAHRDLIRGLRFVDEPPVLRFFFGRMEALDGWGENLVRAFQADFGPDL
ncbi:MAG: Tyrosine phenol-lyase [Actinobacteria bacterium ADurb.Bin444]|nr:MAG: Tyrosine phenol-lyase [Actinobacteria bacterium ADurb.Bin444]